MRKFLVTAVILGLFMVLGVSCEESEPQTSDGLFLTVMQPIDESLINNNEVNVIGNTLPGAVVSINGILADVDEEGNFETTISLEEGPNLIEVIASDQEGNQESGSLAVIYVP